MNRNRRAQIRDFKNGITMYMVRYDGVAKVRIDRWAPYKLDTYIKVYFTFLETPSDSIMKAGDQDDSFLSFLEDPLGGSLFYMNRGSAERACTRRNEALARALEERKDRKTEIDFLDDFDSDPEEDDKFARMEAIRNFQRILEEENKQFLWNIPLKYKDTQVPFIVKTPHGEGWVIGVIMDDGMIRMDFIIPDRFDPKDINSVPVDGYADVNKFIKRYKNQWVAPVHHRDWFEKSPKKMEYRDLPFTLIEQLEQPVLFLSKVDENMELE